MAMFFVALVDSAIKGFYPCLFISTYNCFLYYYVILGDGPLCFPFFIFCFSLTKVFKSNDPKCILSITYYKLSMTEGTDVCLRFIFYYF